MPSQAWDEMQRLPVGFLDEVILTRRYVEAYRANEANVPGWEQSELRSIAQHIKFELAQEEIDGHG